MARYSLFVLKVPLNPMQTNNQLRKWTLNECLCVMLTLAALSTDFAD